ncbi:hypothetical protein [Streptomyces enissocaesilis]|uniref:Uncharacterized protein n=1 Tax=Streptomyces enissocaesilis TaxID=332589 RepID=A0ABP6K5J6_9ACTN
MNVGHYLAPYDDLSLAVAAGDIDGRITHLAGTVDDAAHDVNARVREILEDGLATGGEPVDAGLGVRSRDRK